MSKPVVLAPYEYYLENKVYNQSFPQFIWFPAVPPNLMVQFGIDSVEHLREVYACHAASIEEYNESLLD